MKITTRSQLVEKIATGLNLPRLQISVILAVTALAGFLTSLILLRFGLTSMTLRYPIAVITAYCVFLICLRIWIWWQTEESNVSADINPLDALDAISLTELGAIGSNSGSALESVFDGGGNFSGGGSGGSWTESDLPNPMPMAFANNVQPINASAITASSSHSSSSGGGGGFSFDFDLDDGIALILILIIIALVLSALIYVVLIAPFLFAELLIDTALVGGLYGSLKGIERRYWLWTALRKTGIAALIVVILVTIAGLIMESANPEAVSIGQFFSEVE